MISVFATDIMTYYESHGQGEPVILINGAGPCHHILRSQRRLQKFVSWLTGWVAATIALRGAGRC